MSHDTAALAALLERFRRGAELIAAVMTGVAGNEQLDFTPEPGAWSMRQILCHLADSEMVAQCEFRAILAEDRPAMWQYDADLWAQRLDYGRRKLSPTLESFRRTRAENYELLKELAPEAFERTGIHPVEGEKKLLDLLQDHAEKAQLCAQRLQSLRQQYKAAKSGAQAG
jgi:hypothetical protein